MIPILSNLILRFNQLIQAVLHRVTAATIAAEITTRAQIGYNDTVNKIVYHDGSAVQTVASETYVTGQVAANVLTVAPTSAAYLSIIGNQIDARPLLITRPVIDAVSTSLAAALAARTPVYNLANIANADLQAGDSLILPAHTGGMQVYIHNGGVLGSVADFTLIETPNLDNEAIRALLSGVNGITYTPATGQFKLGGTLTDSITALALGSDPNGQYFVRNAAGTSFFNVNNSAFANAIKMTHAKGEIKFDGAGFYLNILSDGAVIQDARPTGQQRGLEYSTIPVNSSANTLIHKGYVDNVAAKRSTQTVNTVANTFLTITHGFALADKDSIQVALWEAGKMVLAEVETVDANSVRIRTGAAITGLKVFLIA